MPVFVGKRLVASDIGSSAELLKQFPELEVHNYDSEMILRSCLLSLREICNVELDSSWTSRWTSGWTSSYNSRPVYTIQPGLLFIRD